MTLIFPARTNVPGHCPAEDAQKANDCKESRAMTEPTDPTVQTIIKRLRYDIEGSQETIADAEKAILELRSGIEHNRQTAATARAFIAQYQALIDHLEGRDATPTPPPEPSIAERQRICALALADLTTKDLPVVSWGLSCFGRLDGQVDHSGAESDTDWAKAREEIKIWAEFLGAEVTETEPGENGIGYVRAVGVYEDAHVDVWAALHGERGVAGDTAESEAAS